MFDLFLSKVHVVTVMKHCILIVVTRVSHLCLEGGVGGRLLVVH